MEADRYCMFFLVSLQAFDKVCHELLYKVKSSFPTDFCTVISSYLLHRTFRVIYGELYIVVTQSKEINSGVSQNTVLGPMLYLLYTAVLPIAMDSTIITYADDGSCGLYL
jgi:hypothetical protein